MSKPDKYINLVVKPCLPILVLLMVWILPAGCQKANSDWYLFIEDPRCGTTLHAIPVEPGDIFSLQYIHSVTKSPVEGTFMLTENGKIKPLTTSYTTHGIGLPVERYLNFKIEDGLITVYHEEEPRENIRLWATDLSRETIYLNDQRYPLFTLSDSNLLVEIFMFRNTE